MRASVRIWLCVIGLAFSGYDWPRAENSASNLGLGPRQRLARVQALTENDSAQLALDGLRTDDIPLKLASIQAAARTHAYEAIPLLRILATDTNETLRAAAITSLARLLQHQGQTPNSDLFVRALGDAAPSVRIASLVAIEQLKLQGALTGVLGQIDNDTPAVRAAALRAASALGPACLSAQSRLSDDDPEVAVAAIAALRTCPATTMLAEALAARLQTSTDQVSERAASALVQLDHPKARELIGSLLSSTNTSPTVTRALLAASGYGTLQALDPVLAALTQPQLAATAEGTLLRWISDRALLGDTEALIGLRAKLLAALASIDTPSSVLPLARVATELGYWADVTALEPVLEQQAQTVGSSADLLTALANIRTETAALTVLRGLDTAPDRSVAAASSPSGPGQRLGPTNAVNDRLLQTGTLALLIFLDRGWIDGRATEPVEQLFEQLTDAQLEQALAVVPSHAPPRLIPSILGQARGAGAGLRAVAVRTAARLARAEDTHLLEPYLVDPSRAVRLEAAIGIARFTDEAFLSRARAVLSQGLSFDRGAFALASQGRLAMSEGETKLPPDEAVAFWTLAGLAHSPRAEDQALLAATATDAAPVLGEVAMVALAGALGTSNASIEQLLSRLGSRDPSVVTSAALALGQIAERLSDTEAARIRASLGSKLQSEWPTRVNVLAAWTLMLRDTADPSAKEVACRALFSRDPAVRTNAVYALAKLRVEACGGVSAIEVATDARALDVRTAALHWSRTLLSNHIVTPASPRYTEMVGMLRRCAQTQPRTLTQSPTPTSPRLIRCGIPRNDSIRLGVTPPHAALSAELPSEALSSSSELAALRCPGEPTWIVRASRATHRVTVPAQEGCVVDSAFVEPLEPALIPRAPTTP